MHIDHNEIQSLLAGATGKSNSAELERHVEQCDSCRERLESLAATPKFWEKISTFLVDDPLADLAGDTRSHWSTDAIQSSEPSGIDRPASTSHLLEPAAHPELLGRLDQYDIEREVGRGGMGVVFKAHDSELNRSVAIKIMAPHLASSGAARKRFAREARAAAAILHPNVISIHAIRTDGATPFLVMPFIGGKSLNEIVTESGPLGEKEIVRIAMQIAAGLAAAHSQGVVHRDIKPANVLIENGVNRVVITDFGLARAEDDASMTQTGWFAGTPNFMSPEQSLGHEMDHRSDLFSLGSVIYFMATGRLPFRADQPMAVLNRIRSDHPTPIHVVNSDVSRTLSDLAERLLEKRPDDRVQSAAELHSMLEEYLAYLHRPASSRKPVFKRPRWRVSPRLVVTALSLVIAAGVAGIGIRNAMRGEWNGSGTAGSSASPQGLATGDSSLKSIADTYDLRPDVEFHGELNRLEFELSRLEAALVPNGSTPTTLNQGDLE